MASLPSPLPLSPNHAASRGLSSNISYETFAPRSAAQIARLSRLASLTAGPTARAAASKQENEGKEMSSSSSISRAMLPPMDRYNHASSHSDIELQDTICDNISNNNKTLQQATTTCTLLSHQLKHTTSLKLALRATINICSDVSNRHAQLLKHSGELSAAADQLQEEQELLMRHAEEIGLPLKHYDAIDKIGVLVGVLFKSKTVIRGLARIKVDDDEFGQTLDDIDDACDFFERESGGKAVLLVETKRHQDKQLESGSLEYFRRALILQDAALDLIKEAIAERIATTTTQVASALNTAKVPISADQLEASLIYTRFHGISSRSQRLLSMVKARLHRSEKYHELLLLCRNTYCSNRSSLLTLTVRSHMDTLQQQHGPVGMTRLASVFMIRLCTVETSLYLDFFGEEKKDDATNTLNKSRPDESVYHDKEFQDYLASLCSAFHRTVRRSLVTMVDLDTLCQIVSVLREERSMASSSPTTLAAARAMSSVVKDAQERLIFCANSTLNKEVIRFKAKPSDLDYPDKLVKDKQGSGVATLDTAGDASSNDADDDAVDKHLQQVYASWFPPMRSVLRILSKIFRVVEPPVFESIALEAVQACTRCLKDGAAYIKQRKDVMHSDLFLVKHLLILREQLSPFDIELRYIERQLDFSEAGKAVARFMANRNRRLFSMSTENALLTLMREGVSVQESSVDSKRDLEDALRSTCNDFIEHTSTEAAGELLKMVEQCRAAEIGSIPYKAIMNCDSVLNVLEKSRESIESHMNDVSTNLKLYMDSAGTQSILLKPVIRKITRSIEDIRKLISQMPDGELEWSDEKRQAATELMDAIDQHLSMKKATNIA
ncbi:hypothetical protein MPSEU_000099900 [Mayamaea pseudoterrestris]|nr:hypothetical protein MPSEU_000099900 [Mayamaea pseudoterrestris]